MDIRNFFFQQEVEETELSEIQTLAQAADHDIMTAAGIVGICSGAVASENGVTLSVDLTAGVVYDQTGQRVAWDSSQNVLVSQDSNGTVTAVVTPGNERWVSIFAVFARENGDARVDGLGNPVLYQSNESFQFRVLQGAEAGAGLATRPALQGDAILLCDVILHQGDTLLDAADISTTRRQWAFPVGTGYGTAKEAIAAILASPISTFATGLVVNETNDETAILGTTDLPTSTDYKLLMQAPLTVAGATIYMRMYVSNNGAGASNFHITINARRDNTLNRWEADHASYGTAAELLFGASATGAIQAIRARISGLTNWTTWPISSLFYAEQSEWEGDGPTTAYVGWEGSTLAATNNQVGVGAMFRKKFLNVPSSFGFTPGANNNISSPSTPTFGTPTVDGVPVLFNTVAANTWTYFFGTVLAS